MGYLEEREAGELGVSKEAYEKAVGHLKLVQAKASPFKFRKIKMKAGGRGALIMAVINQERGVLQMLEEAVN